MRSSFRHWTYTLLLTLVVLGLPLGARAAATHPNQPQGFSSERAYQLGLGGLDQVDLYSGRLSLTIPIGPFTLYYNNNVWRYSTVEVNGVNRIKAIPDRQTTAGLGWHLGWGELYEAGHWYNSSEPGRWMYVGDDGRRHFFYDRMHYGDDPDGDTSVFYTRDNSYLRLKRVDTWTYDIEFPDGSTRRFHNFEGTLSSAPFRLTQTWGPFASAQDPDVTVAYLDDDTLRTVTDRYGRIHKVYLAKDDEDVDGAPVSWMTRLITSIEVEGFGGARNTYTLGYRNINVSVSCKDDHPASEDRIRIPHLTEIRMPQPDGTAYTMLDGANPAYVNLCEGNMDDVPGSLTRIDLPTGGALRWTYQRYEFPPGDNHSVFNTSAGVATREMIDADGTVAGTWTYATRSFGSTATDDPEIRTDVVAPEGDCRRHYFNAIYFAQPSQGRGWELGLPFTFREQSGGKYLSSEIYDSNDGAGLCTGTKLRSHYQRFRRDQTPGCIYVEDTPSSHGCPRLSDFWASNRTVEASRTVFHDDGDRYVDVERSGFDGLGNFRTTVTTGNLWALSANDERREVEVAFDRVSGTYGAPGYQPPGITTPWILGLHSSVEITETEAVGETTKKLELAMDPATGALDCTRVLKSGTARDAKDLLTTYAYDSLGFLTDVKRYGSDRQSLPTTGAGCGDLPAANPVYWTTQTWADGFLETRRPRFPAGGYGPFLTYDVDRDFSTGLVTTARDPAGFAVDHFYDVLGRLVRIEPDDGADTEILYTEATSTSPAEVSRTVRSAQGFQVFGQSETVFDAFGRPTLERRLLPGSVWSEQETVRNARGWVESVSQWGDLNRKTRYLSYDALGRPRRIRPADGAAHDVTVLYLGRRKSILTQQVAVALDGTETAVTKEVEYDSHGRLRRVREGAGVGGAMVPTVYSYDVAGHLSRVIQGSSPQQVRSYVYDNRGFLRSETQPEKGATGGGTLSYYSYDAAGNPHRILDGPNDLGFEYDYAGRLKRLYDRGENDRTITSLTYDGATGDGLGKIWKALRHNYVDLPWVTGAEETVTVEQVYAYEGRGGATSHQETLYTWPQNGGGSAVDQFRQTYVWDEIGNLERHTYPWCLSAPCAGTSAATTRTLDPDFSLGRLTGLPGWITSVTYGANGAWSALSHNNGVTDHRTFDPLLTHKLRRVWTTGVTTPGGDYDSGIFAYDGAGNVKNLGGDAFAYDGAGRLTRANYLGPNVTFDYEYDVFGNLLERGTTVWGQGGVGTGTVETYPVDPASNRLTGDVSYDDAGNLTSWEDFVFTYDAENNLTGQAWMRYIYDAAGERVGAFADTPAENKRFDLRDLSHRLVSELSLFNGAYKRNHDTIFAGGRLIAKAFPTGASQHYHLDHLGTPRLMTNDDGSVYKETRLTPYGQELPFEDSVDNRKLTGHERDYSTGADYMHARHYHSELGRFFSVDPLRGRPNEPQSLNRYAYVSGNPINFTDPLGLQKARFTGYIEVWGNGIPFRWPFRLGNVLNPNPWGQPGQGSTDGDGLGGVGGIGGGTTGGGGGFGGSAGGGGAGGGISGGDAGGTGGALGPENPEIPGPNLDLTIPLLDVQRAREFYQNLIKTSDSTAEMFALEVLLDLMPQTQEDLAAELVFAALPPARVARLGRLASRAQGASGKQAQTLLRKIANQAGFDVQSGKKYLWVVTRSSPPQKITKIPHSPHARHTIQGVIDDIFEAAGL